MTAPCPVFGFSVLATLHDDAPATERDALVDDLEALLAEHGLLVWRRGRGLDFVVRREGAQATEADRNIVSAWAVGWADRAAIAIGELADLTQDD